MKYADVVIIGGSLAGAACARELTRRGVDAVAFDRDRFPREKVCGGFLSPGAVALLDELAMLGPVRAAGATTVHASRVRIRGREVLVELPKPGMGVSRKTLDALMASHPAVQHGSVRSVRLEGSRFRICVDSKEIFARVVIDAAGKLSRFTPRRTAPQFGVQFYEPSSSANVLDFWFFDEGYGGTVAVEGGRSNACFLINKDALLTLSLRERVAEGRVRDANTGSGPSSGLRPPFLDAPASDLPSDYLVTGPVAYNRLPSDFIAIGDAAGMVDPFCGEGMRHALDTGLRAARIVADGLSRGKSYDNIRYRYEEESTRRWAGKRRLGALIRSVLRYPRLMAAGFRFKPEFWFRKLWE